MRTLQSQFSEAEPYNFESQLTVILNVMKIIMLQTELNKKVCFTIEKHKSKYNKQLK